MKKILSLLLILAFVQNNYAQSMRQIMVSMPDSIMPLLTKVNREDCMDYLDSKMKAEVTNRIGSKSEMTKITDDYAQFKLSKSSERTFKLLPTADNDTIICMITTCCGPVCDSKLDFFDNKWNRYKKRIIELPTLKDFISKPDSINEDKFNNLLNKADILLMKADFKDNSNDLTLTLTTDEYLNEDDRESLKPFFKKEITLEWNGKKFEKKSK